MNMCLASIITDEPSTESIAHAQAASHVYTQSWRGGKPVQPDEQLPPSSAPDVDSRRTCAVEVGSCSGDVICIILYCVMLSSSAISRGSLQNAVSGTICSY